jgi:3-hydroxyanthranilate 3,4-dioxygenase
MSMPEPYAQPYTIPFDLHGFIAENEEMLKTPPTNVKALWRNTDFIAFLVGGPNRRLDFHDDPFEEFFYQIRGDIYLDIMTDGGPGRIDVPEGHLYLLPPHVRHSPQRPEPGSLGLVIERVRPSEAFEWYCRECHSKLHRAEVSVTDIERDLPPVFAEFHRREDLRTCGQCGAVHPGK